MAASRALTWQLLGPAAAPPKDAAVPKLGAPTAAATPRRASASPASRAQGGRGLAVRAAQGEGEGASAETVKAGGEGGSSVDLLPSGEWAHNFSMLNYEDLQAHYAQQGRKAPDAAGETSSPLLPDKSHGVVSGEWSESVSLLSYEDLSSYFQQQLFKQGARPDSLVADVMQRQVRTAFPDTSVGEIRHHFDVVGGLPVVDESLKCVGVVTRYEVAAAADDTKVKDIMTTPPVVTMAPEKSVLFAAVLMLKNKVHRIPVVNEVDQLVGIVTRTDIFTVLEEVDA